MFDCSSTRCPDLEYLYRRAGQLLPVDAVDDVVQEAALAAWQMQTTRERAGVRTWLCGVLRHKVADFYRRDAGRLWVAVDGVDDVAHVPDGEDVRLLRMLLWSIHAEYAQILWLRFYAGLTFDEVGVAMGISTDAARGRYRRAVSALREEYLA